MPTLYLISGCNGAGKTTASFTMLPEKLNCHEFINADIIAEGISPLQPGRASIEAGRIMLQKIDQLIKKRVDFGVETTLSGRNYLAKVNKYQNEGYNVVLVYLWLNDPLLAIARIKERANKGGAFVPDEIVTRRYYRGIKNLFKHYIPLSDYWSVYDNSGEKPEHIADGIKNVELNIFNKHIWAQIKEIYDRQ